MSTKSSNKVAVIPPKPLTVIERASQVFAAVKSEDELKELAKASATIVTITNDAGYTQCHAARMALKNIRLEITRVGEQGREDAVQTSKAIIAKQKALVGLVSGEEDRLAAIQEVWDDRIEAEKEAKIQAELKRVQSIQDRLAELRGAPAACAASDPITIWNLKFEIESIAIDSTWDEFVDEASKAKQITLASLTGLHAAAVERENEVKRIMAERAELAELRRKQAETDRIAAEERAKQEAADRARRLAQEAQDRADRDREFAARQEIHRLERQRIAEEEAQAKAIRDQEAKAQEEEFRRQREVIARENAENARIAKERQNALDQQEATAKVAREAEDARLANERDEIQRQQEALIEAQRQAIEAEAKRLAEQQALLDDLAKKPEPIPEELPSKDKLIAREAAIFNAAMDKQIPDKHPESSMMPSPEEIIDVVADEFCVSTDTARFWMSAINWDLLEEKSA